MSSARNLSFEPKPRVPGNACPVFLNWDTAEHSRFSIAPEPTGALVSNKAEVESGAKLDAMMAQKNSEEANRALHVIRRGILRKLSKHFTSLSALPQGKAGATEGDHYESERPDSCREANSGN